MKAIIRQTAVNCKTPFNPDDEDGQKVVKTIRDSVMLINQAEALIEKTKSELKQYESESFNYLKQLRVEAKIALGRVVGIP